MRMRMRMRINTSRRKIHTKVKTRNSMNQSKILNIKQFYTKSFVLNLLYLRYIKQKKEKEEEEIKQ